MYVDPGAGKVNFREYAEQWRAVAAHRRSTADTVERALRKHVYPAIGDRPINSVLPSDLKALVRRMSETLAPSTVSVIYRHVSAIFKAAVADRRIAVSPCASVSVPKPRKAKVVPIETSAVIALADSVPREWRAAVMLAAGTGLRLGEVLGLSLGHIDFLRRQVVVDRQLLQIAGKPPYFGPPKTDASYRTVPLPTVVIDELAAHLAAFPVQGREGLVFTNRLGTPMRRTSMWTTWQRALVKAGLEDVTFHDLRHYYASLLIRHGESVKVVQARLGHKSAVETLDTYSHLWSDSDDRTREAVDEVLGQNPADSVRTVANG
ncbi:tyrosine-type recombinase/integrase [Cellulomonas sp. Leaf395]|uniref:tyrosine-type recombinase/integrase n=1 Tax=Cellulomonas sp. Leaf395 TaxID=1736362 RepID=UPI001F17FB33|nr:site-specific integrase [Cellulomonas sp. Leaf395]